MSKFAPDVPASLVDAVNSILEAKVEPAAPDAAAIARRKKLQALKDKQEDEKADKGETKHSGVRKIAGHSYGGAKQKDEPEQQDEELKGGQKKLDKNHNGKLDADDFKKLRGEKKDEGCDCKEETDLDEAAYSAKAARAGKDIGKPGKNFAMIAAKAGKRYGSAEKGKKVAGAILAKIRAKHEEVEIDERTLTPGETEKKEKYVKSMKKGAAGFKERYGNRAKSVMYATATKMAKEEVEVEVDVEDLNEGKMKDIYTSMMMHADKKGYKSHKDFTPKDYDEVGKEHGISGKDLAVIAGHKTAHQVSKEQYEETQPKKEKLPFTPDKPHAPIAKAGKYGYGPSAAKHLAKQGMKSVKEETVEEGTGGPIYPKPFVKLGDLLSRIKDIRNLKKATIVTPKDENEVVMKKESFEDEHGIGVSKKKVKKETMMGKAGCTSEEVVSEGEDHFTNIPSDVKKKIKAHIEKGDFDSAEKEAHKGGHLLKYHHLVRSAAHSFHQDYDTRHHDIHDLKPYMSDYLTEKVELDETAVLDKYIRSMGYDPQHLDKNKKVMFSKTNAYKTFASSQKMEGLYDGGQKGTQDIDTHMSPGATARG